MWQLDHKESWVLKNWCFWTVVLEKILDLDCREIKPVILKEINPQYSLEGPMLKLKLQYFGLLLWRANSFEKTLMLGKIEDRRSRGWHRMNQLLASGGRSIGASASASVLLLNIQDWFPFGLTGLISLQSKGLSRVFSSTMIQKHKFFGAQPTL